MRHLLITILILLPSLLSAQPFTWQQEYDTIPAIVDSDTLAAAWIGGYQAVCPSLGDLDADGDFDLLVGWFNGTFDYWENIGNGSHEKFRLQERVVQGLNYNPTLRIELWDMDADGDLDLFVDQVNAPMLALANTGGIYNPYFEIFEDTLYSISGESIDGTDFSLADIDADGDKDLFISDWESCGIDFYENIGDSTQYIFSFITNNFAGLQLCSWSTPEFCDIDADGDLDLFVGTGGGLIYYYQNDGTPQQYDYNLVTYQWMYIDAGEEAIPEFCDIDADGDYDLFIGKGNNNDHTVPGALHFWRNEGTPQNSRMVLESPMYLTLDFPDATEPRFIDVNFNGKGDLFVNANHIGWLKDVGLYSEPVFELQSYNTTGTSNLTGTMSFGDLNGDNFEDLTLTLTFSGILEFWINNRDTLNPEFHQSCSLNIGSIISGPQLADMDGDGDNDLIIHGYSPPFEPSYLYYFENRGDLERPYFTMITNNYKEWAGLYNILSILDFDKDGDYDIVAEINTSSVIVYLENIGTPQAPRFAQPLLNFIVTDSQGYSFCDFSDIDQDGDWDAFFGSAYGGILFFRNTTGDTSAVYPPLIQHPLHGIEMTFGPNPANPVGITRFHLPYASYVNLGVYDITGRLVQPLASDFLLPGPHQFRWTIDHAASGVYLLRLQANNATLTKKVIVLK